MKIYFKVLVYVIIDLWALFIYYYMDSLTLWDSEFLNGQRAPFFLFPYFFRKFCVS